MLKEAEKRVTLGDSNIQVSRLCFGTLVMGPLQANLPLQQGVSLLAEAYNQGVNFFDTAESYGTYPYLRQLIRVAGRAQLVIATKSYAATSDEAKQSLHRALYELNTDYLDIMLLHEQVSLASLAGHHDALEYFVKAKKEGLIRAVGLSSHYLAVVRSAIMVPEIEIVHPLYNREGFGIQGGSAAQMLAAIDECFQMGKGIYAMKVLGGGHLYRQAAALIQHVAQQESIHSIAIGMRNAAELQVNLAWIHQSEPPSEVLDELQAQERRLHIESHCTACGRCLAHCPAKCLHLVGSRLQVDHSRCLTCGYCARVCPDFALKVL